MLNRFCVFSSFAVLIVLVGCDHTPDIDKVGGTRLVYKIAVDENVEEDGSDKIAYDVEAAESIMQQRLDPTGRGGITVNIQSDKLEIAVPECELNDVETVKIRVTAKAELSFQIVAEPTDVALAAAVENPSSENEKAEILIDGKVLGRWVPIAKSKQGDLVVQVDEKSGFVRDGTDGSEILLRTSDLDIVGKHLGSVSDGKDDSARPVINFALNPEGANRMAEITRLNFRRRLAIVIGNRVVSAPTIQSQIQERGQISGNFTDKEVAETVELLRVGMFPFKVSDVPPAIVPVAAK